MKLIGVLLLAICAAGCGYSSKSGMVATAPTITQLMPNNATAGGPAFTLTVNGSNFVNGAVVYWNGVPLTTTFAMASQVSAAIPASDLSTAGTVPVYVRNPGGTGIYMNQTGQNSNTLDFTIMP